MVGLVCPDESLPPETIQHYASYLALVSIIRTGIHLEIDTDDEDGLIGDDLLDGYQDTTDDNTTDDDRRVQTPEEREERIRNMDLISRQAEKSKDKVDKAHAGTYTKPVEVF
jgi:hypothetical protein